MLAQRVGVAVFLFNLFFFFEGGRAWALNCPAPHPRYDELLSRLDSFRKTVNDGAKCQSLAGELGDLHTLYSKSDRELIERAVHPNDGGKTVLTVDEIKKVGEYAESVTAKIAGIVNQLREQPKCLADDQKVSTLSTIASITREVTSVGASFSGPYGVPIAIGGQLIAGILRGIDSIIEGNSLGYHFEQLHDRRLFVANLCSFHQIRQEITDLLEPSERIRLYDEAVLNFEIKKGKLNQFVPEAAAYFQAHEKTQRAREFYEAGERAISLIEQRVEREPWNACSDLSRLVHGEKAIVPVLADRIEQVDTVGSKEALDLIRVAMSDQGVLKIDACWKLDEMGARKSARYSTSLLREILRSSHGLCQHKLDDAILAAGSPTDTDHNKAVWMKITLERIAWALDEKKKMQNLECVRSASARSDLVRIKSDLEDRLFRRLGERFLDWYLANAEKGKDEFESNLKKLKRELPKLVGSKEKDLSKLLKLARGEQVPASRIYSLIEPIVNAYLTWTLALKVDEDFCDYFSKSGTLTAGLHEVCVSSDYRDLSRDAKAQARLLAEFREYLEWCHQNGRVEADSLQVLIQKIKKCHEAIGPDVSFDPGI